MKHTPGSWTVETDSEDPQTLNIRSGSVPFVASVWGNGGTPFEQAANARLIAAAPDLLAALRLIANSEETHGDSFVCDFETLQSVARAAIAKAGE